MQLNFLLSMQMIVSVSHKQLNFHKNIFALIDNDILMSQFVIHYLLLEIEYVQNINQ